MHDINPERHRDDHQEMIISAFLHKYYFSRAWKTAQPVYDNGMQSAGVDMVCNDGARNYNIDVKAQSSANYINNPRPTFSLELSTYNRYGTEELEGWFLNPHLITEYYTFVWIHSANTDARGRIRSCGDIEKVEVMTVHKQRLKRYLDALLREQGIDDIDAVIREMRLYGDTRRNVDRDVHFSHSPHLPEKPVNLVVHKRLLEKFAISGEFGHCYVTKGEITAWTIPQQ